MRVLLENGVHAKPGTSVAEPTRQTQIHDLAQAIAFADRAASSKERAVLGIVGPPGAGKSTIGEKIVSALAHRAVLVPMDGFHLSQSELIRQGRRDRMGAPDTFDVTGFAELLRRLRRHDDEVVYAPRFDRSIEEPIAGAIAISPQVPLVIIEGNYLLHDADGWQAISPLMDDSWYLEVPRSVREERLIRRRIEHGDEPLHSANWVRTVDEHNAQIVQSTRELADAVLELGGAR